MRLRFCCSTSGSNKSVSDLVSIGPFAVHPPASFGCTRISVRSARRSASSFAFISKPLVLAITTVDGIWLPRLAIESSVSSFCTSELLIGDGVSPSSSERTGEMQITCNFPTISLKKNHFFCASVTSSHDPAGIFACSSRSGLPISAITRLSSTPRSPVSTLRNSVVTARRPRVVSTRRRSSPKRRSTCSIIWRSSCWWTAGSGLFFIFPIHLNSTCTLLLIQLPSPPQVLYPQGQRQDDHHDRQPDPTDPTQDDVHLSHRLLHCLAVQATRLTCAF